MSWLKSFVFDRWETVTEIKRFMEGSWKIKTTQHLGSDWERFFFCFHAVLKMHIILSHSYWQVGALPQSCETDMEEAALPATTWPSQRWVCDLGSENISSLSETLFLSVPFELCCISYFFKIHSSLFSSTIHGTHSGFTFCFTNSSKCYPAVSSLA